MTKPPKPSLSRRDTAGWVLVTGIAQGVRIVVTLLSAAILARLLLPVDFGLIATAAPILAFTAMLQNLGLNEALVQRPNLEKHHINALFYLMVGVGAALAGLLLLAAPLFAAAFHEPRLIGIIRVMAVTALITAAASTPIGLMNRRLQFKQLALIDITGSIVGFIAGIAIAVMTHSYWALVATQVATAVVQLGGGALFAAWRPGAAKMDEALRNMIGLGAGFTTFNLLNFLSRNADALLIASFHGPTALGFYDRAYKLMLFPLWQSVTPFGRVLTPVLARLQEDPPRYRERYFEATAFLMAAVQPGVLAAVVFSNATVLAVLGPGWEASGPIFFWLGLTALHQIYSLTLPWLFVSQGRAAEFALLGGIGAAIAVTSFVIGLPFGPVGVAMAYAIGDFCIRAPVAWWFAGRKGPVDLGSLIANFLPHAIAMIASAALLLALSRFWSFEGLIRLGYAVIISYVAYAITLCFFGEKRRLVGAFAQGALKRLKLRPS
ncbi:MAG: oligosaccharide flippase family protein [Alphaproteobacteria bacterium]|nr:oligosaccharide flippase family protein [Alphaproteobacteria bacterium]